MFVRSPARPRSGLITSAVITVVNRSPLGSQANAMTVSFTSRTSTGIFLSRTWKISRFVNDVFLVLVCRSTLTHKNSEFDCQCSLHYIRTEMLWEYVRDIEEILCTDNLFAWDVHERDFGRRVSLFWSPVT